MNFKLSSFYCILSSEYVNQIKYRNSEYTKLGLLTISDTLESARVHTHTLQHNLSNTYGILKKMTRFLSILPVIIWRRFNGNVLINSGTFRFKGILTWGRFDVHTD